MSTESERTLRCVVLGLNFLTHACQDITRPPYTQFDQIQKKLASLSRKTIKNISCIAATQISPSQVPFPHFPISKPISPKTGNFPTGGNTAHETDSSRVHQNESYIFVTYRATLLLVHSSTHKWSNKIRITLLQNASLNFIDCLVK